MDNASLLQHFYSCFQKKDHAGMAACYHPDVEFNDPVFTLKGKEVAAMWHMLCEGGKDLVLRFSNIQADERSGSAHWEADYTFSMTGRKVCNVIEASFEFKDGKIYRHTDRFSFWRWSGMALGMSGKLLGWTPVIKNAVAKKANERLKKFIEKNPRYK